MSHPSSTSPHAKSPMPVVLVCVIALLVGLTFYVAFRPSPVVDAPPQPVLSEEQRVLQAVDGVMSAASARSLDASATKMAAARMIDLMRSYIKANPRDYKVRLKLIDVLMLSGANADAIKIAEDILAIYPASSEALWRKGELLRMDGKGGEEFFEKAATSPDASPDIWSRYGCHLMSLGEKAQAAPWLEKGFAAGSQNGWGLMGLGELAIADRKFEQAHDYFAQAVKDPQVGLRAWLLLAETRKYLGRLDEAADAITECFESHRRPDASRIEYGEMQLMLGQIRRLQRRYDEASGAFIAAGRFEPLRLEAYVGAAQCLYTTGGYAQAMKYIDLAYNLSPSDQTIANLRRKIEDSRFPRKPLEGVVQPFVPVGE